ncbi:hypothetical protein DFS34DRAFT_307582 [Phlyctochytrium arcticum]|nr:hypothetical protein DFS34DRAFT_307582 [Phlyctochytrium arcticum]
MNLSHLIVLSACTISCVLAQNVSLPWYLDGYLNGVQEMTKDECGGALTSCWVRLNLGFENGTYPSEEFDTRVKMYSDCRCHQYPRCPMIRHEWSSIVEKKVMQACHVGAYNNALMVIKHLALETTVNGLAEDPPVVPAGGGFVYLPYPVKNAQGKIGSGNASEPLYNLAEMSSAGAMNFRQSTALFTAGLVLGITALWE